MEQLERITYMEQILNEGTEALAALFEALEQYSGMQEKLKELFDYYESPLWMQDHDDDCAGKIPQDLRRGVLTEDAVYDLLTDQVRLMEQLRTLEGQLEL